MKLLTDRLGFFFFFYELFINFQSIPTVPRNSSLKDRILKKIKIEIPVLRQPPVEMFLLTFDNTVNKVMKSAKQSSPAPPTCPSHPTYSFFYNLPARAASPFKIFPQPRTAQRSLFHSSACLPACLPYSLSLFFAFCLSTRVSRLKLIIIQNKPYTNTLHLHTQTPQDKEYRYSYYFI